MASSSSFKIGLVRKAMGPTVLLLKQTLQLNTLGRKPIHISEAYVPLSDYLIQYISLSRTIRTFQTKSALILMPTAFIAHYMMDLGCINGNW